MALPYFWGGSRAFWASSAHNSHPPGVGVKGVRLLYEEGKRGQATL